MLAVSPTVFQLNASLTLLHSRLKVMVCVFLSFLNISKVSGYVLKKQTSNSYRLTLVEELPFMHEVIRAVTPPASKEKAQFLSSTVANDASLCCASATHHDASDEKLCTSLKRISLSDE